MKFRPVDKQSAASRRQFLKILAAGTAAAMAGPAAGFAQETGGSVTAAGNRREARAAVNVRAGELEKGIEEQKGYLRKTLEAIRAFELDTNSEPALTFAPLRAPKRGN